MENLPSYTLLGHVIFGPFQCTKGALTMQRWPAARDHGWLAPAFPQRPFLQPSLAPRATAFKSVSVAAHRFEWKSTPFGLPSRSEMQKWQTLSIAAR